MLRKLSFRNAKRQFGEYVLFFVTLSCLAAFMYAFNALLFSDSVKSLPDMEVLPYLIVAASLLIILIMGWITSYMLNYMLKRRSREFGVYMVSGIPNKRIRTLIFFENCLIGMLAFLPGLLLGILLSQLLEAVLLNLFGLSYMLHFGFSLPSALLTFLYFSAMLLYSVRKNGKWIRKVQLRDMLYFDKQNEKPPVSGSAQSVCLFFLSVLAGCSGFLLLSIQPLGKGFDILIGALLLALFLFGFFLSIPAFLVTQFGNRPGWKYGKHRLVTFRGFTAKIHSASIVMGVLSILFMLSVTFGGIGTAIGLMVSKDIETSVFDLMILHEGDLYDFSRYEKALRPNFPLKSHTYGIYTDKKADFIPVRSQAILEAGRPGVFTYAEFQYDTYLAYSDYVALRKLLGYETLLPDDPSSCYVHCVPALEKRFKKLLGQQKDSLQCEGFSFAAEGVFSEPFSQMNDYGNGSNYIIIVPDEAASHMEVLYSVYAAVTETPLNSHDLKTITGLCKDLVMLSRSTARSSKDGKPTAFFHDGVNYLSGKWADKAEFHYLYSMPVCLFYLALILEMTGAAILATQVLSDWQKKQAKDKLLRQLGMNERLISRLNNRQLSQIFLLPLLPSLLLSGCFVSIIVKKMLVLFFPLPIIPDALYIGQSFFISLLLFLPLYSIYYAAALIHYGRRQ